MSGTWAACGAVGWLSCHSTWLVQDRHGLWHMGHSGVHALALGGCGLSGVLALALLTLVCLQGWVTWVASGDSVCMHALEPWWATVGHSSMCVHGGTQCACMPRHHASLLCLGIHKPVWPCFPAFDGTCFSYLYTM